MTTEFIDGYAYRVDSREHIAAIGRRVSRMEQFIRHDAELCARMRGDANATSFLARDLVFVSRDIQKVLYEALRALEFVPMVNEVPRGARTWIYRQMDIRGEAEVGHLGGDDAPRAEVNLEEFPFKVVPVKAAYGWTIDEMEHAAFSGVPLSRDKADATAEIMARKLDQLTRVGDASRGLFGFFNNPDVPIVTLTNGEWLTATADEIVDDLAQIEQAAIANSRDNHTLDRLILPTAFEGRLATLQRSSGSDMSVKTWFLANSRMINRIDRWIALDDATGADTGVSDDPQGICYAADPRVVRVDIPIPYEELAPQIRNYERVINARAAFAGVTWKRPVSGLYIENLD